MKCGHAFKKARQEVHSAAGSAVAQHELRPGDMFIALDNQKPGNINKFTDFLKDVTNKKSHVKIKRFEIVYDFASIKAGKFRTNGAGIVTQVEHMIIATCGEVLTLPVKDHKPYGGCNLGSSITGVILPPYNKIWSMKYEDKKQLYSKMRLPIGGGSPGNEDEDE